MSIGQECLRACWLCFRGKLWLWLTPSCRWLLADLLVTDLLQLADKEPCKNCSAIFAGCTRYCLSQVKSSLVCVSMRDETWCMQLHLLGQPGRLDVRSQQVRYRAADLTMCAASEDATQDLLRSASVPHNMLRSAKMNKKTWGAHMAGPTHGAGEDRASTLPGRFWAT